MLCRGYPLLTNANIRASMLSPSTTPLHALRSSSADTGHRRRAQICEAYGANRYPFPEDPARRRQMMAEVTMRLRELHTTIEAGPSASLRRTPHGLWLSLPSCPNAAAMLLLCTRAVR